MIEAINQPRFGSFLRNHREEHGISLRKLAGVTGLDPAYLSKLERNLLDRVPQQNRVNQIVDALCRHQGLPADECNRLRRRVLDEAGYLVKDDDLIADLSNRFADKLRDAGMREAYVLDAVQQVSLDQMRKVLLGEERLEIRDFHDVSPDQIQKRRSRGEQVVTLAGKKPSSDVRCPKCNSLMVLQKGNDGMIWRCTKYPTCRVTLSRQNVDSHKSIANMGSDNMQSANTSSSATDYLKLHSHEFDSISNTSDSERQSHLQLPANPDPETLGYINQLHGEITELRDQLMMIKRPYFRYSVGQLEELYDRHRNDPAVVKDILQEMNHWRRRGVLAKTLLQRIHEEQEKSPGASPGSDREQPQLPANPDLKTQMDPLTASIKELHTATTLFQNDQLAMIGKLRDEISGLQNHLQDISNVFKALMEDR